MAGSEHEVADTNSWVLRARFEDVSGEQITCGEDACDIGSYEVSIHAGTGYTESSISPACRNCRFVGALGDVFNPEESRFIPEAPERYKKAAARVLTTAEHSPLHMIRAERPDTAAMIEGYVTEQA